MTRRIRTHLVGSLPFADAREAMEESLRRLGRTLPYAPDGETGERGNYIRHLMARLERNPALKGRPPVRRLAQQPTEFIEFSVRAKPLEIPLGELGYCRDWAASLGLFRKVRDQHGDPDLRYLMGVAPPLSIAAPFFSKPFSMLRAIRPLRRALRAEITEAIRLGREDLVVQLDAALEQIAVAAVHGRVRPAAKLVARYIAKGLARLVEDVPHDVPVGVHLCLGNPMNQRIITPPSSAPVVVLANAVAKAWPEARPLDFIHLPIVDSTDAAYYEPLRGLKLPLTTRVIAGLVYEDGHAANTERLALATEALGYTPDIACACGMGRRTPEVARALLDEMRALTGS